MFILRGGIVNTWYLVGPVVYIKTYIFKGKCQNQLYLIRSSQNQVHIKTK